MASIRMMGFSGLDVEGMIKQLMNAERLKYDRLYQQNISLNWKQEAYTTAADSLQKFKTDFLNVGNANTVISTTAFKNYKLSSSSDAVGILSAGPAGTAKLGDYKIRVARLATKDIYESELGKFSGGISGTPNSDVLSLINSGDLKGLAGGNGEGFFSVVYNGTSKTISITEDDIDAIESAAASGADPNVKMEEILNNKLRFAFGTAPGQSSQRVTASFDSGTWTFNASNSNDAISIRKLTLDVEKVFGIKSGASSDIMSMTVGDVFGDLSQYGFAVDGSDYSTFIGSGYNDKGGLIQSEFKFNETTTMRDFLNNINKGENGVDINYDRERGTFVLSSQQTGTNSQIRTSDALKNMLGMANGPREVAVNAEYYVNGVMSTSTSNTNVNHAATGLVLNLNAVTDDEVDVSVKRDVENAYKMIMSFIEGYNEMVGFLDGLSGEKRSKTSTYSATSSDEYYSPLTDTQKESMSDREIELWEAEAKKGMLYNDPILEKITLDMRNWIYEPVKLSNGKTISLHEIGITTGEWRNKGKLELWTDAAGNEKFTMELLEERFDDIVELFTNGSSIPYTNIPGNSNLVNQKQRMSESGIAERLSDLVNNAIHGKDGQLSQAAGILGAERDDKNPMFLQKKSVQERMVNMLSYLQRREDYYYAMFARMEQAMQQSESQMSALMSTLGGGQ